jgi:hypothetical protein
LRNFRKRDVVQVYSYYVPSYILKGSSTTEKSAAGGTQPPTITFPPVPTTGATSGTTILPPTESTTGPSISGIHLFIVCRVFWKHRNILHPN